MNVDISGSRDAWTKRNTGRVRKCPAKTMATTTPMVSSVTDQPGKDWTKDMSGAATLAASVGTSASGSALPREIASNGINASIGTTAISCISSTEKLARPPAVRIRFFSFSVCRTIAVDDSETNIPRVNAISQARPSQIKAPATAIEVPTTCAPPMPISLCRISHSAFGSSSSPIRNSIITTPNSAKCCRFAVSLPTTLSSGPSKIPAAK